MKSATCRRSALRRGLSTPIFGSGRRALAAITLMAPHQRVLQQEAQLVQATLAAAARISRILAE